MRRKKPTHEVDTGMFADIAFLMLIFFMVVTTFNKNHKLQMTLPPHADKVKSGSIASSRLLNIFLNANGQVMVGDKIYTAEEELLLTDDLKRITASKKSGVVKINMAAKASYKNYLLLLNQIKLSKKKLNEQTAIEIYGKKISQLSTTQIQALKQKNKFIITEIESHDS